MALLSAFTNDQLHSNMIWGVIPFSALISWVFWMMEGAGDYTENPFEALAFDVPMTSLTRTIEIDLRQMIGETDLPSPIGPKDGFVV
jgi:putative membrane protein